MVKSLRDHGALPQWRLMWRQFRRHRLALIGLFVLVPIYFMAVFVGLLRAGRQRLRPHVPAVRTAADGCMSPAEHGMFVYGYSSTRNQETFEQTFTVDKTKIVDVGLFVRGDSVQDPRPDPVRHPPDRADQGG